MLFAPDILNCPDGYHSAVVFSPDGTEAFWTQMTPGELTMTSRLVDGIWTAPQATHFHTFDETAEPFFHPDGSQVYFLRHSPTATDPEDRERIWYVERTSRGYSPPQPMPDVITAHPTHWQFSLARNSNLYFGSRRPGVRGEQDIYLARFDGERYLEPEDLGPNINSDGQDLCPFIDPDERYLLFVRDTGSQQGANLFLSRRLEDGTWSEARELPGPINSDGHDLCPVVTLDGRYLFFISNRSGESLVYWVKAGFIVESFPGGNP